MQVGMKTIKLWIGKFREFSQGMKDANVTSIAGESAFFLFLSIFPLLNLILGLATLLPISEQAVVDTMVGMFPDELGTFIRTLIKDIFTNGSTAVTIVSIATGLWSSAKGVNSIRKGMNTIYNSRDNRNFLLAKIVSVLYTAVFVILLLLLACASVFGRQAAEALGNRFTELQGLTSFLVEMHTFVSMGITFLFMLFMYSKMPHQNQPVRFQIPGALFAATAWTLISLGFSYIIELTMRNSYMYGSLTTIIILLFWIYIMVNVIFLGAEINVFLSRYVFKEKVEALMAARNRKKVARARGIILRRRKKREAEQEKSEAETAAQNEEKGEAETAAQNIEQSETRIVAQNIEKNNDTTSKNKR